MGRDVISEGFAVDRCERCGIHNDEIGGVMMQCSKCKNAYYCSMKCFNEDMERHLKFCNTGELMVDNHHRKPHVDEKRKEEEKREKEKEAAAAEAKRKAKARAPRSVKVEMPDGDIISIHVIPGDTDKELKKKIKEETGMETKRQVLHKGDEEWPKGKSCREMGVRPSDTLRVEIRKVPITVNQPENDASEPIHLLVDPYEPLQSIKQELESHTNMPVAHQELYMEGTLLEKNDTPCRDYGIKSGSVLDLEPATISVIVEMPDGSSLPLQLQPRNDTIDDIKERIEQHKGIPRGQQIVSHQGTVLPENTTCRDMGLKDKSMLQCRLADYAVTVNAPEGPVEVMVNPSRPLADIKADLEHKTGIAPNNQHLSMDGKELVGDNKSARDHGITPGQVSDLEPKSIEVNVEMPDGSHVPVSISPQDNSDDIKEQIQSKTGMLVSQQVLKKDGTELPNSKSAKAMGLKDGSNLKVDQADFAVTVNAPEGPVEVMVNPSRPLADVKADLEHKTGIAPSNQHLSMDGKELVGDNKSAGDHGIAPGKVLDLEPVEISIEMPDGSEMSVNISLEDVEKLQHAAGRMGESSSSSDGDSSKSEEPPFKFKSKDYNGKPWSYSLDEANQKRDNAFNWFHRMGRPDKKSMERQVKKLNLPDITVADVQLLPWVWGGRSLDVEKMKALHDKDFVDIKRRLQQVEDSYHDDSD